MLMSEPCSLTSLKSSAYWALVSAFGPSVRSISALGTINGSTFPNHDEGSDAKFGGVGRQMPGAGGYSVGGGPKRPSFARASSIAAAAAFESVGFAFGCTRYGWWPRSIALTASYTAPCTIAKSSTGTSGGAFGMIVVEAIRFQSVTASARATGGHASATTASAMKSGRIGIFLN